MIKTDVISGFLGAGKTTFIRKMIEEAFKGEKIVLIENEFGDVGIDGGFLKDAGIEITEMNSGCICCTLVGDFDRNLKDVAERFHPDRIIIEPSGVGKLSDVTASIVNVSKEHPMEINALVTVVNAKKAAKQMKAFGEFFNNQIEFANTIVLSRTQEMDEKKLSDCVALIKEKNPKAAIVTTPWDDLTATQLLRVYEEKANLLDELLKESSEEAARHAAEHEHEHHHDHEHHHHDHDEHEHHHEHGESCSCGCHHHDHDGHHHHADEVFDTFGVETPHKFDRELLEKTLKMFAEDEDFEDVVIRAKGIVECTDGKWAYFDMVPGSYEIRDGEPDVTGRIVVIGTRIDENEIKKMLGMN